MAEKLKVGINGLGRIGRVLFRQCLGRVEVVGLNSGSGTPDGTAYSLKYDSCHGICESEISALENEILVDGKAIPISFSKNPEKIPWKEWGVDLVFECTGAFKSLEDNKKHLQAGAQKVIVSAPANVDTTFVYGINHTQYKPQNHHIVSNASCTTNCLAPVAQIIHQKLGLRAGTMTTVHSYTNDQKILDSNHRDLRRSRAGGLSMIPTVEQEPLEPCPRCYLNWRGKFPVNPYVCPRPNVSLVDLNAVVERETNKEEVNGFFIDGAKENPVLGWEKEPLVSVDFNGRRESAIVDLSSTEVVGGKLVHVLAWYDNEVGFSARMVDLAPVYAPARQLMAQENYLNFNDLDVSGKKVFLRLDLNVPLKGGSLQDPSRIDKALSTLKISFKPRGAGGGRLPIWVAPPRAPQDWDKFSLDPVASYLNEKRF